jgi:hypothetical protein
MFFTQNTNQKPRTMIEMYKYLIDNGRILDVILSTLFVALTVVTIFFPSLVTAQTSISTDTIENEKPSKVISLYFEGQNDEFLYVVTVNGVSYLRDIDNDGYADEKGTGFIDPNTDQFVSMWSMDLTGEKMHLRKHDMRKVHDSLKSMIKK